MVKGAALLVGLCTLAVSCGGPSKPEVLTPKEISQQSKPAIVRVLVYGKAQDEPERIGSGFIVSPNGLVATNLHVFTDLSRGVFTDVRIGLLDGRLLPVKRVIAIDASRDLAILSIDAKDLPVLELGDSDRASAGDPVVAIGHPVGQFYTVSDGLISSWRLLDAGGGKATKILQISAPISVGSSGGPLFDSKGKVIGVNTAIAREGQNLNFAIPSNYLRPLLTTASGGEPLARFAARFAPPENRASGDGEGAIVRKVPRHDPDTFSVCSDAQLKQVREAIQQAIEVGAPLYNSGNSEACFKIYRSTHTLIEQNQEMCKPVRDAFGNGLLRATTVDGWKAKAWALRDSFDGLLMIAYARLGRG
jgi:S1-C subfamily serine protease